MRVEQFRVIPQQAKEIRQKVFIEEQGFEREFDDIDKIAVHFVVFDDFDLPIATCRVFQDEKKGTYILGRLAVIKENRDKNIGARIVAEAESYVKQMGGDQLKLHAQCRITEFYSRLGFAAFGEVEEEEGCPHVWMGKVL